MVIMIDCRSIDRGSIPLQTEKETEMDEDTIAISKNKHDSLQQRALKLACLEDAGVDNWEGYGYAMEAYFEALEKNEDTQLK